MTFSYALPDQTGVFAAPKDEVRFLITDTVSSASSVADEEIQFWLKMTADPTSGAVQPIQAAALAADAFATRLEASSASRVDVGPFHVQRDLAVLAQAVRERAAELRAGTATGSNVPILSHDPWSDSAGSTFHVGMTDGYGYGPWSDSLVNETV